MNGRIDRTRMLPRSAKRWGYRLGLGVVVGMLAGLAAVALEWGIHFGSAHLVGRFTHTSGPDIMRFEWSILLLPALGGLLSGLIVFWMARQSHGHGVDQLTRAFHHDLGDMALRGPAVKGAGAALVISCGGSAGPEGPIAALGAAIGSVCGRLVRLTPHERRILLLAGCAAGIGAIFRCPLGGALFATSIIYGEPEFESDAIVTAFVASVVGYSTFIGLWGVEGPFLQGVSPLRFVSAGDLTWYAILGPLCGLTAIFFFFCLSAVERVLVPRSRVPRWLWPALGGLATGALACMLPQVMDGRYGFLQNALDGELFAADGDARTWLIWAMLFIFIALAKCVATAFTVGSGAPGGVLGPSVFIGGAIGAALGAVGHVLFPDTFTDELRRALIPVGMAGVLAATMRSPLASIVIVTEMTGSFGLIAPLMLVCVTSYIVGRRWGLNQEQVPTAAQSPAHVADPIIHMLQSIPVGSVMQEIWPMTVAPDTGLDEIVRRIEPGTRPVIAVSGEGQLQGIITTADLGHVLANLDVSGMLVATDAMSANHLTVKEDDDLYSALNAFNVSGYDVLPVVGYGLRSPWVGMLTRASVAEALHQQIGAYGNAVLREHTDLATIQADLQIEQLLAAIPARQLCIQRLFVPIDAVGKSLRECDFRQQFNIEVIAVEQRDGTIQCPPDASVPLRTDQRLLAVVLAGAR